jgi:hypothetical protein
MPIGTRNLIEFEQRTQITLAVPIVALNNGVVIIGVKNVRQNFYDQPLIIHLLG